MFEKLLAMFAAVLLAVVVGLIAYQELCTTKVVVDVTLKKGADPFQTFKTLLPPDSRVVDVKEVDKLHNEYKITVSTRRHRLRLLEWMRSSSRVEKVEEVSN